MGLFKSVKKAFKSVENHVKGAVIGKKNCERLGAYKELKKGSIFNRCGRSRCSGRNSIFDRGGCSNPVSRSCGGQRAQNQQQSNFLIRSYEKLVSYLMNILNMNGEYDQYGQNDNNILNQYNYYNNGMLDNTYYA